MSHALSIQVPQRKLSSQMRAVLSIFRADPQLMKLVEPFINLDREDIEWDKIFRAPLSNGQKTAAGFAFGIWRDELRSKVNIFDGAHDMEPQLKWAVITALAMRWSLVS